MADGKPKPYEPPKVPDSGLPRAVRVQGTLISCYGKALVVSVVIQGIILLFAALLLDGGATFRMCRIAAIAYWPCALLIILRRPTSPTKVDVELVQYGYVLVLGIVYAVPLTDRLSQILFRG